MPKYPTNLNLARIVHRLMTSHRGWRVDALMAELDIAPRTYRKYRRLLQDDFPLLRRRDGKPMVQEVEDGESRYLRLIDARSEADVTDTDFAARIAAMHFARLLLGFLRETDVGQAMTDIVQELELSLRDRQFVVGHLLRNADRMFYLLPDAPKDYADQREIVQEVLHALLHTYTLEVDYDSASLVRMKMVLEPYSLVAHRSALYLIALREGYDQPRIFAVDRIRAATRLERRFDYPKELDFDPARYTEGSFGIFRSDSPERIVFELLFADKRWLKMFVQERRWHPTQRFESQEDGRLLMRFEVNCDVQVWPWIRSFGEDVEVVSPGAAQSSEQAEQEIFSASPAAAEV